MEEQINRKELVITSEPILKYAKISYTFIVNNGEERVFDRYACMASLHTIIRDAGITLKHHIVVNIGMNVEACGYTLEDAEKWVKFMALCGFPSYLVKEKHPRLKNIDGYIVVDSNDYINSAHFWVALTGLRYIDYAFSKPMSLYPYLCTNIYNELPELDAYQAFVLAHYYNDLYYDGGHAVISYGNKYVFNRTELFEHLKKCTIHNANMASSRQMSGLSKDLRDMIGPLLQKKKYKEALQVLINYKAISL